MCVVHPRNVKLQHRSFILLRDEAITSPTPVCPFNFSHVASRAIAINILLEVFLPCLEQHASTRKVAVSVWMGAAVLVEIEVTGVSRFSCSPAGSWLRLWTNLDRQRGPPGDHGSWPSTSSPWMTPRLLVIPSIRLVSSLCGHFPSRGLSSHVLDFSSTPRTPFTFPSTLQLLVKAPRAQGPRWSVFFFFLLSFFRASPFFRGHIPFEPGLLLFCSASSPP